MSLKIKHAAFFILFTLSCFSCHHESDVLEPDIVYLPPQRVVERLPSPFPKLSRSERSQDWAKELELGRSFAQEMDFYRALTCFKRALFLIPSDLHDRHLQIEYDIFLAYYMGNKYQEAIGVFETSELLFAEETFPPLMDLLVVLYDAYMKNDQPDKALNILCLIDSKDRETANKLNVGTAVMDADFSEIERNLITPSACEEPTPIQKNLSKFLIDYECNAKSILKAKALNAVLPGAGYLYVGQKKSALTSFLINSLFIAAAYQFFDRGYIAGGIIVSSLEMGWYLGGINGAGIEAKEYNQYLYQILGKNVLMENRLFPVLIVEKGF